MPAQVVHGGGGGAWGLTFGELAIGVVIILAVCGIVYIASKAFGIAIPQWLIQILLIVVVACVAIVAIKIVLSM